MAKKTGGWYRDHKRHVLAGRGVKTATRSNRVVRDVPIGTGTKLAKLAVVASQMDDQANRTEGDIALEFGGLHDNFRQMAKGYKYECEEISQSLSLSNRTMSEEQALKEARIWLDEEDTKIDLEYHAAIRADDEMKFSNAEGKRKAMILAQHKFGNQNLDWEPLHKELS